SPAWWTRTAADPFAPGRHPVGPAAGRAVGRVRQPLRADPSPDAATDPAPRTPHPTLEGFPRMTAPVRDATAPTTPASTAPTLREAFHQPKSVWAIAFAATVSFMGIGLVDPILPAISSQLDATPSQAMLLF